MSSEIFLTLFITLTFMFIGITVYLHNKRSLTNILFSLISLSTAFYTVANLISVNVEAAQALLWIRLTLFFALPHSMLFLLFVYTFPRPKIAANKKLIVAMLTVLFITMGITLSSGVFSTVDIINNQVVPQPGPLIPLFVLVVGLPLLLGIAVMVKKYYQAHGAEKRQWKNVFVGIGTTYILLILLVLVGVVVFKETFFVRYVPIFFLPSIIGMANAILRYHLLNVKILATEIFTFVIVTVSIFQVLIANNLSEILIRIVISCIFFVFGILLIRSVIREVEQSEHLKNLTVELKGANEKLTKLDQAKDEFISLASHQLRTPLTAIKGYLSMLVDGDVGDLNRRQYDFADLARASAERMVYLIADMLNVSRLSTGKLILEPRPVDLEVLIQNEIKQLDRAAEVRDVKLSFKGPSTKLPTFNVDENKLRQVIMNFIDNAIYYAPGSEVVVSLNQAGDKIHFNVTDFGIGVPKAEQPRLFTKFFRASNARKARPDGTGLGLYMAKMVVELQGGQVFLESTENKGSTFGFELPISAITLPQTKLKDSPPPSPLNLK